jgi:Flp pilus assembly protein TadB
LKTEHQSAATTKSAEVSATETGAVESAAADEAKPPAKAGKRPVSAAAYLIGWAVIIAIAFISPFLEGLQSILGIIIIGIALYEAWKINRRARLAINGPFRVGVPRPAS